MQNETLKFLTQGEFQFNSKLKPLLKIIFTFLYFVFFYFLSIRKDIILNKRITLKFLDL